MLQNVSNNFRFRLGKCIEANGDKFKQELQECPNFQNDVHLFHRYARFNTFCKINTVSSLFLVVRLPLGIFADAIVYCYSTV
jgi:hypothetical protein